MADFTMLSRYTSLDFRHSNGTRHRSITSRIVCSDPVYMSRVADKFESFERINSIRETNGNLDSCNSCERLGTSRSHELHESKFSFVSRIEFIRSKLSNFSAHVYGVIV